MTKSAMICPFIIVFGLYLMSNSLSSMAHFINLSEVSGLCNTCFMGILLGFRWYSLGSKGRVFGLWLQMPGSVSPLLDTSPLLLSKLGCNSRLGVVLSLCL